MEQRELDYIEEEELKSLRAYIEIYEKILEQYHAFINREKDPEAFYKLEKEMVDYNELYTVSGYDYSLDDAPFTDKI